MSIKQLIFAGALSLFIIAPSFPTASAEVLHADTEKSERSYRKTKTGEGALTQGMLEACIQLKAEIDEEYGKISAAKKAFDTLNKEVSDRALSLKEDKKEKPVREYNEQVDLYNNKLEELKELEKEYNKKSVPYREKTAQLEKECNGQPYYEDDYAAAVEKTGKSL